MWKGMRQINRLAYSGNCGMTVLARGEEMSIKEVYGPDNDK